VVLISDTHLGVYKDGEFMEDVVKKINKIEKVDYVFILGDLTY
jgi:predicted MPP superfamily phosphohydrolase